MSLALTWSQDTWLEPATFRQDEETMDLELLREGGKEREGGKGGREGGREERKKARKKEGRISQGDGRSNMFQLHLQIK